MQEDEEVEPVEKLAQRVETLTGMVGSSQACRLRDVMTHFCHLFTLDIFYHLQLLMVWNQLLRG